MKLKTPYLLFLGDAANPLAAKTALGVAKWRGEVCLGQLRLPGCHADAGLPDMTVDGAYAAGAKTLVVGIASRGGVIAQSWMPTLRRAAELGMDIASGLHEKIADLPEIAETARGAGGKIHDIRHPYGDLPVATGDRRPGRRLLTVGTDCSVGKMFTALAIAEALNNRGQHADFVATGQTGILIAGAGMSVDAVPGDFISGVVEMLCPATEADNWQIVEGQGSLFHPSFSTASIGLLHGAQPDLMVMCHQPGRETMRGLKGRPLPGLAECIALNQQVARIVNPEARIVGISLNTSGMAPHEARDEMKKLADLHGLPVVDPISVGIGPLVDHIV